MTIELVGAHLHDVTLLIVLLQVGIHASHPHEIGKMLSLCFSDSILKVFCIGPPRFCKSLCVLVYRLENCKHLALAFYVNEYLEHFSCRVSLGCPDEVVSVLQKVLEGVEGDFLGGHGQEGGVGGGEVLKQEHASKYHQGEDNST